MAPSTDPGLRLTGRERSVLRKRALFDVRGLPEDLETLLEEDQPNGERIHAELDSIADFIRLVDAVGWEETDLEIRVDMTLDGEAVRNALERMEKDVRSETQDDFRISQATFTKAAELLAGDVDLDEPRDLGDELLEQLWVIRSVRARMEEAG